MDEFGVAVHADCQRLRRSEKKPPAKTPKRFLLWRKTFCLQINVRHEFRFETRCYCWIGPVPSFRIFK